MNRCLQETDILEWMTKGKTNLTTPIKEPPPNNCRPITFLLMMWKVLSGKIWEEIYYLLISHGLFTEEQKGGHKGSRQTGDLLYTDQLILKESKTRRKNLAMVWIDNKKSFDRVLQSWIIHCFKMYKTNS